MPETTKVLLFLVFSVCWLLVCAFVPYSWLRQGPLPERLTNTLWFEVVLRGVLLVSVVWIAHGVIFVSFEQDQMTESKIKVLILGCTVAWFLYCVFAPLSLEMMGSRRYGMPIPERLRYKPWFWILWRSVFLVLFLLMTYMVVVFGSKSLTSPLF